MGNKTIKKLEKISSEDIELFTIKGIYWAKIVSVYDGDTFTIIIQLNNKFSKFKVRLYGVDCPEVKPLRKNFKTEELRLEEKARGFEAKKYVSDLIFGEILKIEAMGFDKYGRLLAEVYIGEEKLSEKIIEDGFGYAYFGGTKN